MSDMDEMWKALQWLYDSDKIPKNCRTSWKRMLEKKTADAAANAYYATAAVEAAKAAYYAAEATDATTNAAAYTTEAAAYAADYAAYAKVCIDIAIRACKELGYVDA